MLGESVFWVCVVLLVSLCGWWGFRLVVALAGVLLERSERDGW